MVRRLPVWSPAPVSAVEGGRATMAATRMVPALRVKGRGSTSRWDPGMEETERGGTLSSLFNSYSHTAQFLLIFSSFSRGIKGRGGQNPNYNKNNNQNAAAGANNTASASASSAPPAPDASTTTPAESSWDHSLHALAPQITLSPLISFLVHICMCIIFCFLLLYIFSFPYPAPLPHIQLSFLFRSLFFHKNFP